MIVDRVAGDPLVFSRPWLHDRLGPCDFTRGEGVCQGLAIHRQHVFIRNLQESNVGCDPSPGYAPSSLCPSLKSIFLAKTRCWGGKIIIINIINIQYGVYLFGMVKELRPGDEGTICKGVECFVLSYVGLLIAWVACSKYLWVALIMLQWIGAPAIALFAI